MQKYTISLPDVTVAAKSEEEALEQVATAVGRSTGGLEVKI